MKHTPGPWSTENIDGTDVVFDPHHFCICEVTYQDDNANACLIAAAPDLLEALEAMMSVYPAGGFGNTEDRHRAVNLSNLAIKKARGL